MNNIHAAMCREQLSKLPSSIVSKIPAMSSDEIMFEQKDISMSFIIKEFFKPEVLGLGFGNFRLGGFISSDLKEAFLLVSTNKYSHWALSAALGIKDDHPGYVKFDITFVPAYQVLLTCSFVDKGHTQVTLTPGEQDLFENRARELAERFFSEDTEIDLSREWVYDGNTFTVADTSNIRETFSLNSLGAGSFEDVIHIISKLKAGEWI
jgi:hypothetical protein